MMGASRFLPSRIKAFCLAAVLAALLPGAGAARLAAAPAGSAKAVLARGNVPVRGLPFLGRNALAALWGSYSLRGQDESIVIEAWHCAEALIIPAGWAPVRCPGLPSGFRALAAPGGLPGLNPGSALWILEAPDYRLFIAFPSGWDRACAFAAVFAERFDWFRRNAAVPSDLSFPVVLDLP